MRLLYAKSNILLRTFTHCSSEDKVTLLKASVQHCVVLSCGKIIKSLRLEKLVSHLINNAYSKIVGLSVRSSVSAMHVTHYTFTIERMFHKNIMVLCKD